MTFSIAAIIRHLLSPQHEVSCSLPLWRRLTKDLRARGQQGQRESGAFLLGTLANGRARIADYILYDDLDPHCLNTGIVRFEGRSFSKLWEACGKRRLIVVADVHTHPCGSEQSESDRAYPMIALKGHIALIVPHFARLPVRLEKVGIYRYMGDRTWGSVPISGRTAFFHIGF